jgi:hypothetical protein
MSYGANLIYENRRTCVKITGACLYSVSGDALTTCSPAGLCDCEFSLCGMPGIWSRSKNVEICHSSGPSCSDMPRQACGCGGVYVCADEKPTKAPAGQRTYTAGLCQTRQGGRKLVFNSGPESSSPPALPTAALVRHSLPVIDLQLSRLARVSSCRAPVM